MNRPTVLLFDIDGTLVNTGGAGRRALERAFDRHCGRPDACESFGFSGMTDPAIARAGLIAVGLEPTLEAIQAVLDHYLEFLSEEVPRSEQFRVLPGVYSLLDRLEPLSDLAIGLGTGNLRRGASVKLARADLDRRFGFGGFGCDFEQRGQLIRRGAERGAERLGARLEDCRVVVIGDTPKDVQAAIEAGAECVGVATGHYKVDTLLESGAHYAVPDLEAPEVMELLVRR